MVKEREWMDDMRLLDDAEISRNDCKYCLHMKKMRTEKMYKTGQKVHVIGKYCPYVKCPYEKNTSKT